MESTLTIFKNNKDKVYCIHNDITAFSIMDCQSITVPNYNIEFEISDAEKDGYKKVSCDNFYKLLYSYKY